MSGAQMNVLVVGATGSIGRLVVEEAIRQGHAVRALVRDLRGASRLHAARHVQLRRGQHPFASGA